MDQRRRRTAAFCTGILGPSCYSVKERCATLRRRRPQEGREKEQRQTSAQTNATAPQLRRLTFYMGSVRRVRHLPFLRALILFAKITRRQDFALKWKTGILSAQHRPPLWMAAAGATLTGGSAVPCACLAAPPTQAALKNRRMQQPPLHTLAPPQVWQTLPSMLMAATQLLCHATSALAAKAVRRTHHLAPLIYLHVLALHPPLLLTTRLHVMCHRCRHRM